MIARAPGKLMLAGEYAVLHGAPALVMAIDRHAVARERRGDDGVSELPREVSATLALAVEEGWLREAPAARGLALDVRALAGDGGRKLGLGSSAAGCVAALAWALARQGERLDDPATRTRLALLARRGHRRAQNGGSGVDVLASALGGVVRAQLADGLDGAVSVAGRAWPAGVPWCVLWSGVPARTSDMIAKVDALRVRDARGFEALIAEVAASAEDFDRALTAGDVRTVVRAVARHSRAMQALGERAGAPVVTPELGRLAARVEPMGGAIKPSGAGGGDVALAVAHDPATLAEITRIAPSEGFAVVYLGLDPQGVVGLKENVA